MKLTSSLVIGILCIIIGIGLTADQFFGFEFGWDQIYPLLLLALAGSSFMKKIDDRRHSAFGIGFFGSLGLFFFLRNFGLIDELWLIDGWTVFLPAVGIGFFVSYFFNPKDAGVLVPAILFSALGIAFMLHSLGTIPDLFSVLGRVIEKWWPLALVIVGMALILQSIKTKSSRDDA